MIPLYTIMRDYFTIIRDYLPIISPIIIRLFYDYTRLFYRLYAIISRRWHPENGNVQTAILDPITEEWQVSVYEEWLRIRIDCKARRHLEPVESLDLSYVWYIHVI
jgi:hypothetical protein